MPFVSLKDYKKYKAAPEEEKIKYIHEPYLNKKDQSIESYDELENNSLENEFDNQELNRGLLGESIRVGTGLATNALAGFAGVPAGIADTVNYMGNLLKPKGTPNFLPKDQIESLKDNPAWEQVLKDENKPIARLPNQEEIKNVIGKALPKGYLDEGKFDNEYLNTTQSFLNEVASDIGSLLFPIGSLNKPLKAGKSVVEGISNIKKIARVPFLSNAAKYLSKNLGASEGVQEGLKLGTAILGSLGMQDGPAKIADNLYKKEENLIKNSSMMNGNKVDEVIEKTRNWSKGGGGVSASQQFVNDVVDKFENTIDRFPSNHIRVKDAIAFKRGLQDKIKEAMNNNNLEQARPKLIELRNNIDNIIKKSPDINESTRKVLSDADKLYNAAFGGSKVQKWIQKQGSRLEKIGGAGLILSVLSGGNPVISKGTAALAGAGRALSSDELSRAISRVPHFIETIFNNDTARNTYFKMMQAAAKQSAPMFLKHAKKLNEEVGDILQPLPQGVKKIQWKLYKTK